MAVVICVIIVSFLKTQIILSSLALGTPFKAFDCSKTDYSIKSYDMGCMMSINAETLKASISHLSKNLFK